jgi:hypothetical protein
MFSVILNGLRFIQLPMRGLRAGKIQYKHLGQYRRLIEVNLSGKAFPGYGPCTRRKYKGSAKTRQQGSRLRSSSVAGIGVQDNEQFRLQH